MKKLIRIIFMILLTPLYIFSCTIGSLILWVVTDESLKHYIDEYIRGYKLFWSAVLL